MYFEILCCKGIGRIILYSIKNVSGPTKVRWRVTNTVVICVGAVMTKYHRWFGLKTENFLISGK